MNSLPFKALLGHETILFVDDEEALVKPSVLLLEKLGYRVVGIRSSMEAIETFSKDPDAFDLVITDQVMPQLTGVELARRMLNIRPTLSIILCTGLVDTFTPDVAKEHGFRGLLEKPLFLHDLATTVRRVLDEKE